MSTRVRNKGKLKCNSRYIENCSEIELFIQINSYYTFLEQLKLVDYYHKMSKLYQMQDDIKLAKYFSGLEKNMLERMPNDKELEEYENALDYCILQTARFNTGVFDNHNGRIQVTPAFEEWYYSWCNYIDNMDEDTYMVFRRCRYEGKGLENFKLNKPISIINVEDLLNQKVKKYDYVEVKENIRQKFA